MSTAVITRAPCSKCPFRKDVPIYLHRARRIEIARALLEGGEFPCHATVEHVDNDDPEAEESTVADLSNAVFCAGAAKSLLTAGLDNQMLRIIERLGMADLDEVEERGCEVWDIHSWQNARMGETAEVVPEDDEEEIVTCGTVHPGCLAPAGYAIGGGAVEGTEAADGECKDCGDGLCSNCADPNGLCIMCSDDEDWAGQDEEDWG